MQNSKKLNIFLVALMVFSLFTPVFPNKASANETALEIHSISDFINMTEGGNYKLMADIDLQNSLWTPKRFSGTLDGNGYTIKNYRLSTAVLNPGLLEIVGETTVKNLTISNVSISGEMEVRSVGALAGEGNNLTLDNVTLDGFNFNLTGTVNQIGGLVGLATNLTAKNVTIKNGYINGNSSNAGLVGRPTDYSVEGAEVSNVTIIGRNAGGVSAYSIKPISLRDIVVENVDLDGRSTAGGIIGQVYQGSHTILNSIVHGKIKSDGDAGGVYGGGSRLDGANVTGVYVKADIVGATSAGGFGGSVGNSAIQESHADVSVLTTYQYAGGFTGKSRNTSVQNSYVKGTVEATHSIAGGAVGESTTGTNYPFTYNVINTIIALDSVTAPSKSGSVVGSGSGTSSRFSNSYYLSTMTGGFSISSGSSGKTVTPEELLLQETYENLFSWSFPFKWTIKEGQTPVLTELETLRPNYLTDVGKEVVALPTVDNLTVTDVKGKEVTLSWDSVDVATHYTVTVNGNVVGTTEETTYTVTGLDNSTEYTIGVHVVDADGNEGDSKTVTITTLELVLDKPMNLQANRISDTITQISWEPVQDAEVYELRRDGVLIYNEGLASFVDEGLVKGQAYTYTVLAKAGNVVSPVTVFNYTNKPMVNPETPQNAQAIKIEHNSITLRWDEVFGATEYIVRENGDIVFSGKTTRYKDIDLAEDTTYEYSITAVVDGSESEPAIVRARTGIKPADGLIEVPDQTVAGDVEFEFNEVPEAMYYTVNRNPEWIYTPLEDGWYKVDYYNEVTGERASWTVKGKDGKVPFAETNLEPGKYQYKVAYYAMDGDDVIVGEDEVELEVDNGETGTDESAGVLGYETSYNVTVLENTLGVVVDVPSTEAIVTSEPDKEVKVSLPLEISNAGTVPVDLTSRVGEVVSPNEIEIVETLNSANQLKVSLYGKALNKEIDANIKTLLFDLDSEVGETVLTSVDFNLSPNILGGDYEIPVVITASRSE